MSRHPTKLAILVVCLLLGACKTAPKAQANNLLAAGDPCDPTGDHELCVYESTFVRLGCNASTSLWQLLGECALTDVCQELFAPGAPDQRLTRCAPFSEVHDAGSTTGVDVVGSPDTASATDTGSKDVAKDSAPTTDAKTSDNTFADL